MKTFREYLAEAKINEERIIKLSSIKNINNKKEK